MKTKTKNLLILTLQPLLCMAFFIFLINPVQVQANIDDPPSFKNHEPGKPIYKQGAVLVKYKNNPDLEVRNLEVDADVQASAETITEDPEVEFAEPVFMRKMLKTPNDTYYSSQWHHYQSTDADIDSGKAWNRTTGKTGTVIAIIDSGVDLDHEDLSANIWTNNDETPNNGVDDDGNGYVDDYNGWDFVDDNKNPNPSPDGIDNDGDGYTDYGVSHGTHVAGLSAAKGNNSKGVTGVCWKCKIMALQVLSDEGWGDTAAITEAINYAVANGADVINMSLGSYGYSAAEGLAVQDAIDSGVPVVAAVGNDTIDLAYYPNYPSCYDGVIGVASSDSYDYASYFSNYGQECVAITAPGSYLYSTMYLNSTYGFYYNYDYMSGTSMASPVVAGAVGLMKSYYSSASESRIKKALKQGADDTSLGRDYGSGRLNVNRSLSKLKDTERPTAPTKIKAYTKPNKKKKIKKGSRTKERTPFFTWTKGTDNRAVAGYYVYWGTKKKAKPKKKGVYKTKRKYKAKKIAGNGKNYYLRVKTKDTSNNLSKKTKTFKYIIDNRAKKPKNLKLTSKRKGVKLTWTCKEKKVKTFNVFRKRTNRKTWKKVNKKKITKKYYTDSSAQDWQKYNYRVQVVDTLYNSKYSKSKTIKYRP